MYNRRRRSEYRPCRYNWRSRQARWPIASELRCRTPTAWSEKSNCRHTRKWIQIPIGVHGTGKIKIGAGKKEKSLSENTPNWNTGISATCALRIMLTSWPPGSTAVASMFTGMICAHKPWFGPELICPQSQVYRL